MENRSVLSLAILSALAWLPAPGARALSIDPCPHFHPSDGARFPANVGAVQLGLSDARLEDYQVSIERLVGSELVPVEVTANPRGEDTPLFRSYDLVPAEPFVAGSYRATIRPRNADSARSCMETVRWEMIEPVAIPSTLGTLTTSEPSLSVIHIVDYEDSRDLTGVEAVSVLRLSPEALPWAAVLDTSPWTQLDRAVGTRTTREFAACEEAYGSFGRRTLRAVGRIHGLEGVELYSNSVSIDLDRSLCPLETEAEADGGLPPVTSDADIGRDGVGAAPGAPVAFDGGGAGCGCTIQKPARPAAAAMAAAFVVIFLVGTRYRSRRRASPRNGSTRV